MESASAQDGGGAASCGRRVAGGWWELPLRVRFSEVDAYGYAWHGHYLAWFEEGRNDLARAYGLSPARLLSLGYLLPLQELAVTFRSPVGLDESLVLAVRHRPTGRAVVEFDIRLRRAGDGAAVAEGRTVQVVTRRAGELLLKYPPVVRQALETLDREQAATGGEEAAGDAPDPPRRPTADAR